MKKISAFVLAIAMIVGLSACGGKTEPEQSKAPVEAAQSSEPNVAPVAKDTVVLATSGEPYRFFPQGSASSSGDDCLVLSNVYDCLLQLEADGSLTPSLADTYEVTEDGMEYTFHLHKGVKFHNGVEMTAEDVKFTLDQGKAGPIGNALLVNYDHCDILDDYTIKITLTSPFAAFPYCVASRVAAVACKSYFDEVGEDGYMAKPIGTGPYKFVEYVSGDHTTLEANDEYWKGAPAIKRVVIQTVADTNTQVLGLRNGDYDIIRNPSIDVCTRFDSEPNVEWNAVNSTGRITMYMASWTGITADKNFRKAVQSAINKDDVNMAMYAGYSEALPIDMCSNYSGYPTEKDGIKVVGYDPEAAKGYLAQSKYNGEPFEITCQSGGSLETAAKVIQAQLMEIGINCTVNAVDNVTYKNISKERTYQAYICNNLNSLVDADGIMTYHRLDRWPLDHCAPRDEELSDLFMKGRAAQGDARLPYYVEGCNIITEEAYDVPLVNDMTTIAYNKDLAGVEAHCLGSYLMYNWSWK